MIKTINVFLPLLRKAATNNLARVLTIGSALASLEFTEKTGIDYVIPYSAAKSAANIVNAKFAARFKEENILFLSISPGMSNTMSEEASEYSLLDRIMIIDLIAIYSCTTGGRLSTTGEVDASWISQLERKHVHPGGSGVEDVGDHV